MPIIDSWLSKISLKTKKLLFTTLIVFTFSVLVLSAYFIFVTPFIIVRAQALANLPIFVQQFIVSTHNYGTTTLNPLFDKWAVTLPRVLFAFIWFSTLYLVVREYENKIQKYTIGIFDTLGKNSLFTYCLIGVLIFWIHFVFPPVPNNPNIKDFVLSTTLATFIVATIYLVAKNKDKFTRLLLRRGQ